jgi:hypothetical protein
MSSDLAFIEGRNGNADTEKISGITDAFYKYLLH